MSDEKERKAVLLYHLEGLTFEEIETQLGWPPGDAEIALRRGLSSLKLADIGFKMGTFLSVGHKNEAKLVGSVKSWFCVPLARHSQLPKPQGYRGSTKTRASSRTRLPAPATH